MKMQEPGQVIRFAAFELDLKSAELRRSGIRVPIQGRPLQILAILIRTPGELVTGEQLRAELWPADTFVDFEHGVRNAVTRLRAALGDSADNPKFVETLSRRGYRFIGRLAELPAPAVLTTQDEPREPRDARWRTSVIAVACAIAVAVAAIWIYKRSLKNVNPVQIKSLAVLPLEDLSDGPAQDYFADGVTDELITMLARMNSVKVISRTSVMQYKGLHNKPLPQIARELGVDAVLEGTLIRTGDQVRITAQLIEAATDRHLWADRYERRSRDLLLLEHDIARAIAEQLRSRLNPQGESRSTRIPDDPVAHELYLQGRYLWNRRTPAALQEAIRYFSQAIEREPRYADAYAGRAEAYIVLSGWAFETIPPSEGLAKAKADADKAVELDDASAQAHTARACILHIYDWNWQAAEKEFLRAIELSPNYATARQWYGQYLCNLERFSECLAETDRASALDPAYLVAAMDAGYRRYEAHQYSEAIAPIQKVLEFNPDFAIGRRILGQVYEANRRYREAITEFQKALQLSGGANMDVAALGHAYAVAGERTEALKTLRRLDDLAKRRYVSNFERALIYVGLGENDRALERLEGAFQERSAWLVKLKVDPRLDPLREDSRFIDMLRRVGFRL